MVKFVPRVCHKCGWPGGTIAYRWEVDGVSRRDYFHPTCFKAFMAKLHG